MSFVAAGHEELRKACTPHYVYPLPIKQALVFHDYTRCWIGTTTLVGTKKFHLNWNINDRGGHKINHRLTFDSPEAMRSTLYHGYVATRSEEHTSELQSLMSISYAVFFLQKKKTNN